MSLTEDLVPYLLLIAGVHRQLARSEFGAIMPVDSLIEQDRLEGSVTKNNSGSEEAIHDGCRNLDYGQGQRLSLLIEEYLVLSRLVLETSKAPTGSSFAAGGTHVPTGLKLIFRCSDLAGDEPLTCS